MATKVTIGFMVACFGLSAAAFIKATTLFMAREDQFAGWMAIVVGCLFGLAFIAFNALHQSLPAPKRRRTR